MPLPPRTPERNATNPPQELLQQLGIPESVTHLSYTFNGNEGLPWVSFIVHFSFSIAFAVLYCVLAERFPQIKLWQGAAFGVFVYVAFHVEHVVARIYDPTRAYLYERLGIPTVASVQRTTESVMRRLLPPDASLIWSHPTSWGRASH